MALGIGNGRIQLCRGGGEFGWAVWNRMCPCILRCFHNMLQSIEASGVPMLMDVHPFFLYRWKCVCLWRCNRSCNWSSVRQAPTGPDDAFERSKAIRQCLGAPTQRDHPGAPWGGPSSWEVWKIWRIVKVAHTKYVINIYIYVIYVSYIYILYYYIIL